MRRSGDRQSPEKLLRAMLLQAFYSIRSERQLMERLEFDLLFRWFVGIGVDDAAWDHSVFSRTANACWKATSQQAVERIACTSASEAASEYDHFSVDGTLIEAWASMKSFRPKDGSDEPPTAGDGRNGRRIFAARSARTTLTPRRPIQRRGSIAKGLAKRPSSAYGACLMENRNGLVVDACLTPADGHAERVAALHMIEPHADRPQAITLGADKAYDAEDFVNELRSMKVTPHVAQNTSGRSSAIDGRTTRHAGYASVSASASKSKKSWLDQDGLRTRANQVSRMRSRWMGLRIRCIAYNLTRLRSCWRRRHERTQNCQINRRWRTVKADICDRHHLARCARW